MTDVIGRISGLLHAPQQQIVDDIFVSECSLHLSRTSANQAGVLAKGGTGRPRVLTKSKNSFCFYLFRWFMYPIYCGPVCRLLNNSATASLAASINSSMIWWAKFLSALLIDSIFPESRQGKFRLGQVEVNRSAFFRLPCRAVASSSAHLSR